MKNIFLTPRKERAFWQKTIALFLTVSMNLSVGGLGVFLLPSVAYAVTPATPIFSDGFETSPYFTSWTSPVGSKWNHSSSEHTGAPSASSSAKVSGSTSSTNGILTKLISTSGYSNIALDYWYKADFQHSTGHGDEVTSYDDTVKVQITTNGTTWMDLFVMDESNDDNVWHKKTHLSISGAENNPNFGIRFVGDLQVGNDDAWIDEVLLIGTPIDTDRDTIPDVRDNCPAVANSNQANADQDNFGDACDTEADLESCTDGLNNDGDRDIDLLDSGCVEFKPTLTVVKNVVGGTQSAENFILRVNEGQGFPGNASGTVFTYTEPVKYVVTEDVAANYNTTFSADCSGSVVANEHKTCTVTNSYDICANIDGNQTVIPEGTVLRGDNCIPIEPPLSCEQRTSMITHVSNNEDLHVGTPTGNAAVLVDLNVSDDEPYGPHASWVTLTGSQWVWSENPLSDPVNTVVESFFDVFTIEGTPIDGSQLQVSADNGYKVWVNGELLADDSDEYNWNHVDTLPIPTNILVSGENQVKFEVTNKATAGGTAQSNPAGLLYKLTVNKNACDPTPVPVCNPEVNLLENSGFEAPVVNGWDIIPFTNSALKWLGAFVNPEASGRLGLELQASVAGAPFAGFQLAELDGDTPTKIWQNVALMPGYDYELSTMYSPRPGRDAADNAFEFRLNDSALGASIARDGSSNLNTVWTKEVRTFLATTTSADVGFAEVGTPTSYGAYLDDASLRCVGKHVPKATVVATKVVCDNESDLPDWSWNGEKPRHEIASTTAQDYVDASEGSCRIDPEWQFEWAPTSAGNPGDNTGAAGEPWTKFVSSALIELGDMTSVWVREVWNDNYVPFTGTADTNTVSAEMYCNGDALHYDNLDYARGLSDGGTVYCVAFNAPVDNGDDPTPEDNPEACSDSIDNDGDEAVDGKDTDCQPKLTVIKHVVNDNGGQKQASEFDLHVNIDVCTNIEGLQTTVPEGMTGNSLGLCLVVIPDDQYFFDEEFTQNTLNSILDLFSPKTAFAGIEKLFAPASFSGDEEGVDVYFEGIANFVVTEDADAGYVTTMSEDCSGFILLGEHKTCTVTNDDVAPVPPGNGGGGSSSYDYWGCTNQAASNFNALANRDDGSCNLPPQPQGASAPSEPQGEVLGAATEEPALPAGCTEYLRDYLKMGKKNDAEQVKLLQTFLNETMDAKLPVTGFFGKLTKNWVKKFQKQYHSEIIQPWEDAGYKGTDITEGTGYVYKTTKRHINIMKCSSLDIPLPDLAPDLR